MEQMKLPPEMPGLPGLPGLPVRNLNYGEEDVDPHSLVINPDNIREHSQDQELVWDEYMKSGPGWAGRILVNRSTRKIIEGEFRTVYAMTHSWPVIPVQWINATEEEAAALLFFYQQTGELAKINQIRANLLLKKIPSFGEISTLFAQKIPDIRTFGQEMQENNEDFKSLLKARKDGEEENEEEAYDPFGLGAVDFQPGQGGGKEKLVKCVLRGGDATAFREILRRNEHNSQLTGERKLLVILGEG